MLNDCMVLPHYILSNHHINSFQPVMQQKNGTEVTFV